jgi:ERCC4-type nuclease
MVVVVDTRETTPLWFPKPPKGLVLMRGTLPVGDYSIRGFEDKFSVERKNTDLYAFLTSERVKTTEKLKRMKGLEFAVLAIEISEYELLFLPKLHSEISPETIRQSLISFEVKYGIHVYYGTHTDLERKVLDWMIYYFNYKKGV